MLVYFCVHKNDTIIVICIMIVIEVIITYIELPRGKVVDFKIGGIQTVLHINKGDFVTKKYLRDAQFIHK